MREPLRMLHTEMKVPSGGNQGLAGTLISVCSTLLLGSQTIHMQIWSPTHITLLIFKLKKTKQTKKIQWLHKAWLHNLSPGKKTVLG